jgi:hypothetical protein
MFYRFPKRLYSFPENEIHEFFFREDYQLYKGILEADYDISERINEVRYYTNPLYRWQMSKYFIHHAFIVFKTEKWWWSIEKNGEGISTIARAQHLENVRDKYQLRRNRIVSERTGIELIKTAPHPVNITVKELIDRLWKGKQMNLNYKEKNGKQFANYIYDKIFRFLD